MFFSVSLQVAIKYIRKSKIHDEHDLNRIRREIKIMSSVKHPHIINVREGMYQLTFPVPTIFCSSSLPSVATAKTA